MFSSTHGVGISGSNARLVSVQVHRTKGARIHTSGMSWTALKHSLARIYAALESCGWPRPTGAITLHIGPEMQHTSVAHLDLPIAISLLCSMGVIPSERCRHALFAGELALDGSISLAPQAHPLNTPSILQQKLTIYTPHLSDVLWANQPTRSAVNFQSNHLSDLVSNLRGQRRLPIFQAKNAWNQRLRMQHPETSEFESIRLSSQQRLALVVAAAGNHHTLIIGSPGTGKSMMARCIHELLPPLDESEANQLRRWSISRGESMALSEVPPFRVPHSQTSTAGLLGTWNKHGVVAGEGSLANGGVLALDEFPEFNRNCIEGLRSPMERQIIQIGRMQGTVDLPFQALIVATANPCPCGYFQDRQRKCSCSPSSINRYLRRITGPISSRFQIHLETNLNEMARVGDAVSDLSWFSSLRSARAAVSRVRELIKMSSSIELNWTEESTRALRQYAQLHHCSDRKVQSIRSIAQTHALLDKLKNAEPSGKMKIHIDDVAFACQLQIFDRTNWWKNGQSSTWRTFPDDEPDAL